MLVEPAAHSPRVSQRSVALIMNPVSCDDATKAQITQEAGRSGLDCQVCETTEQMSADTLARRALAGGAELIIVAGGDGTVLGAINALVGTTVPLGIVPLGTGNLLALNLGIPTDIHDAFDVALNGDQRHIDLVNVNHGERYFAIMGGLGLDAQIMQTTDRTSKQRFGWFAYLWSGIKHLGRNRFWVNVTLDGKAPMRRRVKSVLVGNLPEIGPSIRLFERSQPDDGIIEIGILKANSLADFARLVWQVALGSPSDDDSFDTYQAAKIDIVARKREPVQFDGDHAGSATRLSLQVEPGALNIMVRRVVASNKTA